MAVYEWHVFRECATDHVLETEERWCMSEWWANLRQVRNGWSYQNVFFFPSATVFYMSLSPFALFYSLLPVSAFKGLRWIISFMKNSCCSLFILFAFYNRSLASPLECVLTWQWWRGWMEGELHVVKCEHWHSKLWKNNSSVAPQWHHVSIGTAQDSHILYIVFSLHILCNTKTH